MPPLVVMLFVWLAPMGLSRPLPMSVRVHKPVNGVASVVAVAVHRPANSVTQTVVMSSHGHHLKDLEHRRL